METGKPGLPSVPVHIRSAAALAEKRMDIQAPLTAVYLHTVPYLQPPAATPEPSPLHLAAPPLYSKETLPFLTLHVASGLQTPPGLSLVAASPPAKPKSAGKHVCPHCGRDCMKPSVLEKHLRCHTGERPYPCTTCGVSFKTQSNLYKHRRTQAHARLSSESEQSSLDSVSSSRETCTSSLSVDEHSEEPGSVECTSTADMQKSISEQEEVSLTVPNTDTNGSEEVGKGEDKQKTESPKPPLPVSRHLPLQRQEAMLFSKQWDSSVSGGKSQSHGSTDSGFSESSDHFPSPGRPEHSMDSLLESSKELPEGSTETHAASERGREEANETAREQEQKMLEERISKLISENSAVVEDKQLENVRPRKTVLSKQGSIDLPMPYTYKDSFHFDMKISPAQHMGLQRHKAGSHSSPCSTVEHAPLTRSTSLPFSVALLQPERSSPTSSNQSDYATLARRGSSGQINPAFSAMKPVSQHSSAHRPLVRQTAVDCNHATDGLFSSSSVEEVCTGSLSCDGDGGDICDEPNTRKIRRKKPQKFFYKWYMYRGGTFKRLYNTETGDNKSRKCSTNPEPVPVDHREAGSAGNFTNSPATAAHHPASLSLNSSVDFSHINSSVKAPLRRNLSLSVLPLPTVSRAEAEKPAHAEHASSTSQPHGLHIPSDRKRQRTDEKIISSVEMTDPNPPTHPPPSATANAPLQDANLTFINLPKDPKQTELKGAVFLPSMLNAKAPSVNIRPTTSLPAAKSSFLPKYQLKLPNAHDLHPKSSQPVVSKPKGSDGCTLTALSSTNQTSPSSTCAKNCGNLVTSLLVQTSDIGRMNVVSSTQEQLALTCTVTTLSPAAMSKLSQSLASGLTVVHRQFATTTETTSCRHDSQSRLCSALIQPLQSVSGSVPPPLPTTVAPAVANLSLTAVNNQTSTAFSQSQPYLCPNVPPSHAQLSTSSGLSNPGNRAHVSTNTPAVPFNHLQPAQNIFHVHTADLQICLQIISDEQLALIAPQIERTPGTSLPQTQDVKAMTQEDAQNKAQNSLTAEGSNHEQPGNQKKPDERKSVPTLNTETITPPLSVQGDAGSHLAAASGRSPHPHKYADASSVTQLQSSAGDEPIAASLRGVDSGGGRTAQQEQVLPPNREPFPLDRKDGQAEAVMLTLPDQHMLSGMKSELPGEGGQLKPPNPGAWCRSSQLERGLDLNSTARVQGSASSFSISQSGAASQPASIYCRQRDNNNHNSSKHENIQCNTVGPPDNSSSSLELTESQDVISSDHPDKHGGQSTSLSSNVQVDRHKDNPAVCASIQSPAIGCTEERGAQKDLKTRGHAGTSMQPERTDCRPDQNQEEVETRHWDRGEPGGGGDGVTGEDKNGGMEETEAPSRCTVLPDKTRMKEEDTKIQEDCVKACQPGQNLQDLSQTHSGMSDHPPSTPQKTPPTLNHPTLTASSTHSSLFSSPPLEIKQLFPLQQSGASIIHNQQTQALHESGSHHMTAQVHLSEITHVFSRTEPHLQQTRSVSHQHQKQTSIHLFTEQNDPTTGDYNPSVSCCNTLTSTSTLSNPPSQLCTTTAALTGDNQNIGSPSKSITYLEDLTGQSCNSERCDITNKYQSIFMGGSLHGFQPGDFLTSGIRPVQSCYTEDTSSSDDEGKLIIEL